MREKPTFLDRVLLRLKNLRFVALAILIGMLLIASAQVTESVDRLLVFARLRPDALSLTRQSQRDELSRELSRAAWRRLFWARSYLRRLDLGAAFSEVDEAYRKWIDASEDWSSRIMIFLQAVEQYYGHDKAQLLEGSIQPQFNSIGDSVSAIRYQGGLWQPDLLRDRLSSTRRMVDLLNGDLYVFVRGFKKDTTLGMP